MEQRLEFEVYHPGEVGAGIESYTNRVVVEVEYKQLDSFYFRQHVQACLAQWFDGARVRPVIEPRVKLTEALEAFGFLEVATNTWQKNYANLGTELTVIVLDDHLEMRHVGASGVTRISRTKWTGVSVYEDFVLIGRFVLAQNSLT